MNIDFSEEGKNEYYREALNMIYENNLSQKTKEHKKLIFTNIIESVKRYDSMRKEYFEKLGSLARLKNSFEMGKCLDFSLEDNIVEEHNLYMIKEIKKTENIFRNLSSNFEKDLEEQMKKEISSLADYMKN